MIDLSDFDIEELRELIDHAKQEIKKREEELGLAFDVGPVENLDIDELEMEMNR